MATLKKPKLLLLDEHTAALDPKTAAKVLELSDKIIAEHNLTALMVTHNMKDAIVHGNRLIMMWDGKIILDIKGEEKKNLTVITNSVELVVELNGIDGWTIILTGGRLKPDSLALVGDQTQQMLRRYHVDTAVMSCKGIDLKAGVTDSSEFHAQTKQSMLRCAKKKILILDSSKIDKVSFIDIAPLDAFDIVVTNTAPSKPWLDFFADHNVECLYPGK